jgi:hypothetical protein
MSDANVEFKAEHESLSSLTQADLLGPDPSTDVDTVHISKHDHAIVTAPVLTGDALASLGDDVFPQTALYGRIIAQNGPDLPSCANDTRLFINTNSPFRALVCGVQVG